MKLDRTEYRVLLSEEWGGEHADLAGEWIEFFIKIRDTPPKGASDPLWAERPDTPKGMSKAVAAIIREDARSIVRMGYANTVYLEHHREKYQRRAERRAELKRVREDFGIQSRPRDSQRAKVYRAEKVLTGKGRDFGSIEEIQQYVDKLVGSAWFQRRVSIARIDVRSKHRGPAVAYDDYHRIALPKWAWTERIVLHEVAHIMANSIYGPANHAGHGREFCRTFLELVGHKVGKDAQRELREQFRAEKVKHTLPRKPMSPEQREAAAKRLVAARAAKEGL